MLIIGETTAHTAHSFTIPTPDFTMPNQPAVPDNTPQSTKLRMMQLTAKLREKADACGAGFIGGFLDPNTGEVFVMSNMEKDDPRYILPDVLNPDKQ